MHEQDIQGLDLDSKLILYSNLDNPKIESSKLWMAWTRQSTNGIGRAKQVI